VRVEVNGEPVELEDGATAREAALAVGAEPGGRGFAVALDGEVVPGSKLDETRLREGQRVEVVAAIGGGAQ
jgi:sulfur carrier protein